MRKPTISENDVLADIIHANYRVLVVLDRMGVKLGLGNRSIAEVALDHKINSGAFVLILNLFCHKNYTLEPEYRLDYVPDILRYLQNSHTYFIEEKIPHIQKSIQELVGVMKNAKSQMVGVFYKNYIEEVTEHISYENETVFPYIQQLYEDYQNQKAPGNNREDYHIKIYGEHHDDIEDELRDLKNILIRHLPQEEEGKLRRIVLQQLFELESDLFSHTRIEDEVLIPIVKKLENNLKQLID